MPFLGERIDPLATRKFCIEIDSIAEAAFTEAAGLEAEVEVFEYQEGGNNFFTHKLPGRLKFPNVTLKRGVTTSNELWDWFEKTSYGKTERRNISIVLYDQAGEEVRRWNLTNAYPMKWTGPSFRASDNSISIESIEFAHEGMSPQ
ncbi:MAG: phage tail protein [Chloroflexi bacterium]|nr:phage tail protein [Chloroflexota bacterium]